MVFIAVISYRSGGKMVLEHAIGKQITWHLWQTVRCAVSYWKASASKWTLCDFCTYAMSCEPGVGSLCLPIFQNKAGIFTQRVWSAGVFGQLPFAYEQVYSSCSLLSVQYKIILEITSVCHTVDKLWIYNVHVLVRDVRVVQDDNIIIIIIMLREGVL